MTPLPGFGSCAIPGKVADASVLGAIIFGEPRAEEAKTLLGEDLLYEPSLLGYELASIARKKIFQNPDRRDQVSQSLVRVLDADINWIDVDFVEVLGLALDTGLTTYDASYLYVAMRLSAELVTFDAQLRSVWASYIG